MSEATKRILFLGDHPLIPSGVGLQSKYLIEGLLGTGKYEFFCFGGAIKHPDYRMQRAFPEKYGDRWKIQPVDGHGTKEKLRNAIVDFKPDAIIMVTDPRFFTWVWEMEDEIRRVCPLLYWHVWDNDPLPEFNVPLYESTDYVAALSLKTYGLLQGLKHPVDRFSYIPHSLPEKTFRIVDEADVTEFKLKNFGPHGKRPFIVFWNNRNARRKMTGDVIACFSKFLDKVGFDEAALMMHTDPSDPEGQDLVSVAKKFGIDKRLIVSDSKTGADELNMFYNACDCTINVASAEGFGLSTLESLYAGTPIVVHMTGGLQFQIGPWWDGLDRFDDQEKLTKIAKDARSKGVVFWGEPIFPSSRSCTGSQQVPYIYDDRVSHDDVVSALMKMYKMTRTERRSLGVRAREWVLDKFSMKKMVSSWDDVIVSQIDKYRSSGRRSYRIATL